MIDHVLIPVADLAASKAFYEGALTELGCEVLISGDRFCSFGMNGKAVFGLSQGVRSQTTLHIAFSARDADEVERFHAAAIAAGGVDNGEPGPRPRYHSGYFAAFVLDPDGHNIEAVLHDYSASTNP